METTFSSLIKARYQNGQHEDLDGPLTPTIESLLRHQSVRGFLDEPLARGTLESLIAVGQSASTSSMLQTWSVVAVQEKDHKDAVAKLCGDQEFIRQAPLFLLFCADLHRLTHLYERYEQSGKALDNTDLFVMASLDAAVAGQNVAVAAESLGLGLCYVGAARNKAHDLTELLRLPKRCIALFGMAIGKPDPATNLPATKPRLPMEEVLHRERWNDDKQDEQIALYDQILGAFYFEHQKHGRKTWSAHTSRYVSEDQLDGREEYRKVMDEQGFKLE
ncbi:hypothetical protein NW762_012479 [Fusarium torreyae]|uniref:Nitroreductase domain-containing protein n=1 Tax=Fusarium torreyae TaxID=1237075 RepID=A0A9W8RML3_9HYPO|nr:hypothetical protein NW762_012479 [Fusarium torreyae]